MIEGIGSGDSLARTALEAALAKQQQAARQVAERVDLVGGADGKAGFENDLAKSIGDGVRAVNAEVQQADRLPLDMITGQVDDFHQVAARLKSAELTFKFAMEVRHKLIDAYRETMRMSV